MSPLGLQMKTSRDKLVASIDPFLKNLAECMSKQFAIAWNIRGRSTFRIGLHLKLVSMRLPAFTELRLTSMLL